jgi:MraZ protein
MTILREKGLYVGEFRHNLDAKGRLTVPAKWRFAGDDQEDVYLGIPNPDGYISVLPPRKIAQLEERLMETRLADRDEQATIQTIFSISSLFGCDKQGRINLTEGLLAHAGISREAVLVGNFTSFNIWNPERYEASRVKDPTAIFAALNRIGI